METVVITKKDVNYWRIGLLLLNVATPVLRKLLITKCQDGIDTFLHREDNKRKLKRLESRVVTKEAKEKLYPSSGRADLETWDITLLCVVLKECEVTSPNQLVYVDTLRKIRNENFAHNPSAGLEDGAFQQVWDDTVAAIDGILEIISNTTFTESTKASIQQYKLNDLQKSDIDRARNSLDMNCKIREHLIQQYHNYNNILPVAPLYDDEGLRISELYTDVVLHEDDKRGRDINHKPEDNLVSSYQEIFQRKNNREPVKLILLKGPAGRGKSSFCSRMASVWASAMTKKQNGHGVLFTDDETEMLKFNFVFFLALRFMNDVDSAFEMVKRQLFEEAPMYVDHLEKCFSESSCLLILDGLDEWTSPTHVPLPSLERLYGCTRIISTRPWRQHSIPANMNIRVLEIGIMDEHAIRTLATKILANYYRVSVSIQDRMVFTFMQELRKHSLDSMAEIPLILTYLVCLWKDENGLEESKTVNYGGLLESLIRYVKTDLKPRRKIKLPGSLSFREQCCKFSEILFKLSEFAFRSTVGHDQPTLVFNKSQLEDHFKDVEGLQFCLDNGLLSQSKASGFRANDNVIIQFFHKSVQEFLVAMYVAMSPEDILSKLLQPLTSIQKVLSMSNVLIFISGLRPEFCNPLTKTIAEIADSSPEIQIYRRSLQGRFSFRKSQPLSTYITVKEVQDLVLQCTKECRYNKRFAGAVKRPLLVSFGTLYQAGSSKMKPKLYDFVIKESSDKDVIYLLQENSRHIKSLYIDCPIRKTVPELSNQIRKTLHLQRLHLDQVSSGFIYDLKASTLSNVLSLSLVLDNISQFPDSMVHLRNLTALSLYITGAHHVIERFLEYLKVSIKLEEIDMEKVKCSTHRGTDRCEFSLDISSNQNIKTLSIQDISVQEVILCPSVDLEEVLLSGWMSNPSSIVRFLPKCKSLTTLILGDLFAFNNFRWTQDDICLISDLLPKFESLKHLHLLGMPFGENNPVLNSRCLETISVEDITLTDGNWKTFIRSLVDIPSTSVSGLITTREDACPIQLIQQVSPMHFKNVNISVLRNRAVVKFETNVSAARNQSELGQCECVIHQDVGN